MRFQFCDQYIFLAGLFFLVSAAALRICGRRRSSKGLKISLSIIGLAIFLVPIKGLPLYAYLRGIASGLSIVTVWMLGGLFIREFSGRELLSAEDRGLLLSISGIAGLLLYPSTLGFLPFDSYRIGYQPLPLLIILLLFCVVSWGKGWRFSALCIVVAVAAFNLRIMESDNLWDYLTDPFITVFAWGRAIFYLARGCCIRARERRPVTDSEQP